jgi:hypothetical protein
MASSLLTKFEQKVIIDRLLKLSQSCIQLQIPVYKSRGHSHTSKKGYSDYVHNV